MATPIGGGPFVPLREIWLSEDNTACSEGQLGRPCVDYTVREENAGFMSSLKFIVLLSFCAPRCAVLRSDDDSFPVLSTDRTRSLSNLVLSSCVREVAFLFARFLGRELKREAVSISRQWTVEDERTAERRKKGTGNELK